jgi:peptidyl-prolyl cis-trans isomerase A (cyclophilin A)
MNHLPTRRIRASIRDAVRRYLPILLGMALSGCAIGMRGEPTPVLPPLLDPSSPEMNLVAPDTFKVLFETTSGDFVLEVERELAPLGADRFYNLVRNGYYDGVHFFRAIAGFVVQFGIHGDPAVSEAWRFARIDDDPVVASNVRGTVTFAMAGPDSRTVQLFINLADNSRLDPQNFAPFGRITGGMDAVDRLYMDYGEGAPRGQGPSQDRIQSEGSEYLEAEFPLMDRVIRARLIPEEW